ncbi:MAG: HAMP domain-containing protein [Nitrospirae bacterium]|nr:HAMP domain-containing protein [Nitrospirota bacterium]
MIATLMERLRRPGGLQKQFFVALLIVGIVPGVAALLATYLYSKTSLEQSIGSGFQEIARSTAIRIATAVDAEIDRAERLAIVPVHVQRVVEAANRQYEGQREAGVRRLLAQAAAAWPARVRDNGPAPLAVTTAYLKAWASTANYYVRVAVVDRRGAVVVSTDPRISYLNADQLWWQQAFHRGRGTAYVSSLRLDPTLDDYVFDVAVPIMKEHSQEPIGVVGLVIRRDVLMKTILPIHIGETGHGMLLDTEGTPLICPVLPPTAHLIHEALLNQLARDEPLWFVADNDAHGGRDSIVGAAPVHFAHRLSPASLGGYRWFSFVRQQPEETYAPIYSLLVTVGLIGFGLVVVLASLGFVVGRRIVNPILALRREADSLRRNIAVMSAPVPLPGAAGGTSDAPIRTGDEIEALARAFHDMRSALESSLRTIKTQQGELIRQEKLASVGQLLAALAHDLRNPLGVIRSSAQLILEEDQTPAVRREVTHYVIHEVDRIANLINHFLRYARQKPPEPKRLPLSTITQTALVQWKAQGGLEHVTIDTKFGQNLPEVSVDPDQVKEALVNLLTNAREAMPDGGQVTVTTRQDDSHVTIEVADTGCGIPQENLQRIFEPFFTTKNYGTGLGLTNVKRLIEDNGGTLDIHSEEGTGSRFVIRFLPAETAVEDPQRPPPRTHPVA